MYFVSLEFPYRPDSKLNESCKTSETLSNHDEVGGTAAYYPYKFAKGQDFPIDVSVVNRVPKKADFPGMAPKPFL